MRAGSAVSSQAWRAGWGHAVVFAGQISLQVCYQPVVKVSKCQLHNLE